MKHLRKNIHTKIHEKISKTLHADCYNLRVFSLFEFLHRWLRECNCICAGGFNNYVSINQTFKARSNVRILCYRG